MGGLLTLLFLRSRYALLKLLYEKEHNIIVFRATVLLELAVYSVMKYTAPYCVFIFGQVVQVY